MGRINILGYKCERCRHVWQARGKKEPVVCSKCKSPYWNIPRRKTKKRRLNKKK